MKPKRTWILIANAKSARIIENFGPGRDLLQLEGKTFTSAEVSRFSDQEGRSYSSFSPARHKMETNTAKNTVLLNHVDEILTSIHNSHQHQEFDRLIICAAPQTLGVIRERIPDALKSCTIEEVSKDLTHVPTHDLANHFETILVAL